MEFPGHCDVHHTATAANLYPCVLTGLPSEEITAHKKDDYSRLGIRTLLALAGRSLVIGAQCHVCGSGNGQLRPTLPEFNVSCNQSVDGSRTLGVCKSRCDLQLIACDTVPAGPLTQARGLSTRRLPSNDR